MKAHSDDFTDQEAVAAILRITRGNMRLIERLMIQVEHILVANELQVVTKEVIETAPYGGFPQLPSCPHFCIATAHLPRTTFSSWTRYPHEIRNEIV